MQGVKKARAFSLLVPFALAVSAAPLTASAQVVINEIMYNPAGSDTGAEWIELYNQGGSDVPLVGGTVKGSWRVADGSNHTITDPSGGIGRGSLVVPAGGYLVIASDPSAFLAANPSGSYSVAKSSISLSNTAATVSLIDGTGATVDTVSYTKDQGGSDDGSSLQRASDGTWIAAAPTPGAANSSTPFVAQTSGSSDQSSNGEATTTTDSTQTQTTKTSPVSSYVAPPTPSLFADAGEDKTVIVGADVEFDASAYDKNSEPITGNVRFAWNFGDGTTAEGEAVLHHFSYPGKYPVVLTIAEDKFAGTDEIIVTAEPAALSFQILGDGGVSIVNQAGHDLDLSGWIVRQSGSPFSAQFILPQHSLVLANSSMQISAATLGFRASTSSSLEYPNGTPALAAGFSTGEISHAVQATERTPAAPVAPIDHAPRIPRSAQNPAATNAAPNSATDAATDTIATSQTAAAAGATGEGYLWWLGAIGLAIAAGAAVVVAKRFSRGEWEIVEDTSE